MAARDAGLGVTAVALAAWHRSHRCCPRCGTPTVVGHAGWVRHCPTDGRDQYPRTDPAVIMAVVDDDDRLLLGHAATWPERRFSTLAGYVEPGEGLEQAVRREVDEEVGVRIGEVTYRGSQPWPFPASIMLAFVGRARPRRSRRRRRGHRGAVVHPRGAARCGVVGRGAPALHARRSRVRSSRSGPGRRCPAPDPRGRLTRSRRGTPGQAGGSGARGQSGGVGISGGEARADLGQGRVGGGGPVREDDGRHGLVAAVDLLDERGGLPGPARC